MQIPNLKVKLCSFDNATVPFLTLNAFQNIM